MGLDRQDAGVKREKLPSLTSLRFFAASLIVLHHSKGLFGIDENLSRIFPSYQAVSFFFVLSGFILAYVYPSFETKGSIKKFYVSRFARIWPLHAATLVITVLFFFDRYAYLATNEKTEFFLYSSLALNVFLVQSWIPIKEYFWSFNSVAWSISTEAGFYLFFPLMVSNWQETWKAKLAGALILSLFMVAACFFADLGAGEGGGWRLMGWLNINPLARFFEFCMGMSAALFYERMKRNYRPVPVLGTAVEIVLLAVVVAGMFSNSLWQAAFESFLGKPGASWVDNGVMNSPWFAILILIFSLHRGGVSKCLCAPFFALLGEISFSIYLLHQIMVRIYLARIETIDTFPSLFTFAYFWAVLLAGSYLCWLVVEKPSRKAILGIIGKWHGDCSKSRGLFEGGPLKIACTCAVFAVLVSPVVAFVKNTPAIRIVGKTEAEAIARNVAEQYRNVGFGKDFVLVGADFVKAEKQWSLRLVWKASMDTVLEKKVAVIFLDEYGNVVGKSDFFQSRKANISTPVFEDTIWIDQISVPSDILGKARKAGVCIYSKNDRLKIDRGPRDWNDRRLLIDLPSSMGTDGPTE